MRTSKESAESFLSSSADIQKLRLSVKSIDDIQLQLREIKDDSRRNGEAVSGLESVLVKQEDLGELRERIASVEPAVHQLSQVLSACQRLDTDVFSLRGKVTTLETDGNTLRTDNK